MPATCWRREFGVSDRGLSTDGSRLVAVVDEVIVVVSNRVGVVDAVSLQKVVWKIFNG